MALPVYLSATPPGFWRELQSLDKKIHAHAPERTSIDSWWQAKLARDYWLHPEIDTPRTTDSWRLTTAWEGRRQLSALSMAGKLLIIYTHPDLPDEAKPSDQINVAYLHSKIPNRCVMTVAHAGHVGLYAPRGRISTAVHDAELLGTLGTQVENEPNPTPDDCQLVLDEMRIGASGVYRVIIPPGTEA